MAAALGAVRRFMGAARRYSEAAWFTAGVGTSLLGIVGIQRRARRQRASAKAEDGGKGTEKRLGRHSVAVFSVGVVSGLVGVACWQLLRRYHSPPPERVFGAVLPMLRANAECRQVLGARLRPGLFKAYAYTGGLRGSRRTLLAYTPRSLQLMFQVVGEEGVAGMVSVVVRRRLPWRRALEFSSVAVDLPSGERLLLKGGNEDVVFQGYTQLR